MAVETAAGEEVPWLTSVFLVPSDGVEFRLHASARLLGDASLQARSLTLAAGRPAGSDDALTAPKAPRGRRLLVFTDLLISAADSQDGFKVDLELPQALQTKEGLSPRPEEGKLAGSHTLLVDTHVMGRAEIVVDLLNFRFL